MVTCYDVKRLVAETLLSNGSFNIQLLDFMNSFVKEQLPANKYFTFGNTTKNFEFVFLKNEVDYNFTYSTLSSAMIAFITYALKTNMDLSRILNATNPTIYSLLNEIHSDELTLLLLSTYPVLDLTTPTDDKYIFRINLID